MAMIEQRLRRRVLKFGLHDTETYMRHLMAGKLGASEMDEVVDLLTTNTTSFFREKAHFDDLTTQLLPQIIARRQRSRPRLKFWSAASSEGAEAYTLAMVLTEAQREGAEFDWAVLGTDISHSVLAKARTGVYAAEQVAQIDHALRNRYFMQAITPTEHDKVRIVPELRGRVKFAHLNLMDSPIP